MKAIIKPKAELAMRIELLRLGFQNIGESMATARWERDAFKKTLLVDNAHSTLPVRTQLTYSYDEKNNVFNLMGIRSLYEFRSDISSVDHAGYEFARQDVSVPLPHMKEILSALNEDFGEKERHSALLNSKVLHNFFYARGFDDFPEMLKTPIYKEGIVLLHTTRKANLPSIFQPAHIHFEFWLAQPDLELSPHVTALRAELVVQSRVEQDVREITRKVYNGPASVPSVHQVINEVSLFLKMDRNLKKHIKNFKAHSPEPGKPTKRRLK